MQVLGSAAGTSGQAAGSNPRLVRAAHEFEAQMMKELLKPLNASGGWNADSDDSESSGSLGEFASEALGNAISQQGGLGIANSILQHFSHSGNHGQTTKGIGSGSENHLLSKAE